MKKELQEAVAQQEEKIKVIHLFILILNWILFKKIKFM